MWLEEPEVFGRLERQTWVPKPTDAAKLADYRAADIQNRHIFGLRTRMRILGRQRGHRLSLREVSEHPLFPYSYDTASKAWRGSTQLSLQVLAAIQNVLDVIEARHR